MIEPEVTAGQELLVTETSRTIEPVVTRDPKQAFSERLNALLDEYGYPPKGRGRQVVLAKDFGVSQKGARKWVECESIPRPEILQAMTKKFRVSYDWLANGQGPKRPEYATAEGREQYGPSVAFPHPEPERAEVPHLSWEHVVHFKAVLEKIRMGELTVEKTTIWGAKVGPSGFSLSVVGDSMRGPGEHSFAEGMRIVVDPDQEAGHRSFVVALAPEPVFRQLLVEGGKKLLKPMNPQYPIHPLTDADRIIGKVVSYVGLLP